MGRKCSEHFSVKVYLHYSLDTAIYLKWRHFLQSYAVCIRMMIVFSLLSGVTWDLEGRVSVFWIFWYSWCIKPLDATHHGEEEWTLVPWATVAPLTCYSIQRYWLTDTTHQNFRDRQTDRRASQRDKEEVMLRGHTTHNPVSNGDHSYSEGMQQSLLVLCCPLLDMT